MVRKACILLLNDELLSINLSARVNVYEINARMERGKINVVLMSDIAVNFFTAQICDADCIDELVRLNFQHVLGGIRIDLNGFHLGILC